VDCGLIPTKLEGLSTNWPWVDRYVELLTRVRLDLIRWIDAGGAGAAARQSGGGSPGRTWKRAPGLGFECGLHWEIADVISNRSRGLGGDGAGRSGGAAVNGGLGTPANDRERTKASGRRRSGGRASLPHCGALVALVRRRKGAELWRGELPKCGSRSGITLAGGPRRSAEEGGEREKGGPRGVS
jgi:hypothetical protein